MNDIKMKYELKNPITDPLIGRLRTRQTDCLTTDIQKHIKNDLWFVLCNQLNWGLLPSQLVLKFSEKMYHFNYIFFFDEIK